MNSESIRGIKAGEEKVCAGVVTLQTRRDDSTDFLKCIAIAKVVEFVECKLDDQSFRACLRRDKSATGSEKAISEYIHWPSA